MNKICVYTCITGEYDSLVEIKQKEPDIDYICYTNNKNIKSKTWEVKYISDSSLSNILLARKIKVLGTEELKKYDIVVWIDGEIDFHSSIKQFIHDNIDLKNYDLVGFKHYCRSTVEEELEACYEMKKCPTEDLEKIAKFLESEKYPDNLGLIETTVLFRDFKNSRLNEAMKDWFSLIKMYCFRDQLSFGFAQWKNNLNIKLLNINIWNNKFFSANKHLINTKIKCSYLFDGYLGFSNIKSLEFPSNTPEISLEIFAKQNYKKLKIFLESGRPLEVGQIKNSDNIKEIKFSGSNFIYNDFRVFSSFPIPFLECHGDFKANQPIKISIPIKLLNNDNELLSVFEKKYEELNTVHNLTINSRIWKIRNFLKGERN